MRVRFIVLSLMSGRGEDFPYRLGCTTQGVFVNDALHFSVLVPTRFGFEVVKIAVFDIATEEYRLLYNDLSDFMGIVTVLGGKLGMMCNYDMRHLDIWVMENYGVAESWTKVLSVVQNVDLQFMQLKPLAYSKNGKKILLLKDAGELIWYDLELKVFSMVSNPVIPDFWRAYVSLESLVKLIGGPSTGIAQFERKQKRANWMIFCPRDSNWCFSQLDMLIQD